MNGSAWVKIGGMLGALAVIAGTFGAHGLRIPQEDLDKLSPVERYAAARRMENFGTAVQYHMYHSLAIVGVGLALLHPQSPSSRFRLKVAAWSFALGIALFSGSLYVLGVGGPRWLGAVAPIGGLGMIAGWGLMASARLEYVAPNPLDEPDFR